MVEGKKPDDTEEKIMKIELKSQQPWTAVSALLGLVSMININVMANGRVVGGGLT